MSKKLSISIFIMFILGIIVGFFFPAMSLNISFLGTIYVNLLKILIVPVLFFSITAALSAAPIKQTGKITTKTIILFIIMFCVSFLITCGIVTFLQPGAGFTFVPVEWNGNLASTSFSDFILALFPTNILAAASTNTILPVIIFAFAVGIAYSKIYNKNLIFFATSDLLPMPRDNFFEVGNKIFNKILSWVMWFTPIGVFSLMSTTVANYGIAVLGTALKYIGTAWLCCIIVCALVMILPVWIYCKINPIEYIKKASKVWIMTLSTCSSSATLPVTIKTCNEEFGIPSIITNLVVPLGCTIHMCGGAVSFALLALFNAQMLGMPITFGLFIVMLISALLINMGAPGIPGGGIVIGATYLNLLGMPLDFIGFYAGIYRLLDMPYTTMNVTGDITANLLIHKKFLNE